MQRLAVGGAAVLSREQQRTCFFVAGPGCEHKARLLVPAVVEGKVFDPVIFADVEFPCVARRVAAQFRRILHRDQLGPNRRPPAISSRHHP